MFGQWNGGPAPFDNGNGADGWDEYEGPYYPFEEPANGGGESPPAPTYPPAPINGGKPTYTPAPSPPEPGDGGQPIPEPAGPAPVSVQEAGLTVPGPTLLVVGLLALVLLSRR